LNWRSLEYLLFPNPTNGELFADLSRWQGKGMNLQILDSRGARVQSLTMHASSEAQAIPLARSIVGRPVFPRNNDRKWGKRSSAFRIGLVSP
jgi:hypothetical protein